MACAVIALRVGLINLGVAQDERRYTGHTYTSIAEAGKYQHIHVKCCLASENLAYDNSISILYTRGSRNERWSDYSMRCHELPPSPPVPRSHFYFFYVPYN